MLNSTVVRWVGSISKRFGDLSISETQYCYVNNKTKNSNNKACADVSLGSRDKWVIVMQRVASACFKSQLLTNYKKPDVVGQTLKVHLLYLTSHSCLIEIIHQTDDPQPSALSTENEQFPKSFLNDHRPNTSHWCFLIDFYTFSN